MTSLRELLDVAERDWPAEYNRIEYDAIYEARRRLRNESEGLARRVLDLEQLVLDLADAHQRCCDESDYCYACDEHPSHGHADDCPLARVDAIGKDTNP